MKDFIQKLFRLFKRQRGNGLDIELTKKHDADRQNFQLGVLGGWLGYAPKYQEKIIQPLSIKEQKGINSCVPEAICVQKEIDEGVALSPQFLAAYLVSQGLMYIGGTSLRNGQKALQKVGTCEWSMTPNDYEAGFREFTAKSLLTKERMDNALSHASKSYWQTASLDDIIQQLDDGRIGHTGCMWYSGYTNLRPPYIMYPLLGTPQYGHSFAIIGYKLDYQGQKVLVYQNSWGPSWGDNGRFYVRFNDFEKFNTFSTYFNLDIMKDAASWLSLNASKAIKEKNGPKVYIIESDKKRWVPDIALMMFLDILPQDLIIDEEGMLPQIKDGPDMNQADIPPYRWEVMKRWVQLMSNEAFVKEHFHKYFPDLV